MSFFMEKEQESVHEEGKFTTTIYRKPTFSGVYSNYERFSPSIYKFDTVYTLVYRCFHICSNLIQFHRELTFPQQIFQKNGYPENLISKFLKSF